MNITKINFAPIGWARVGKNGLLSLGPTRRSEGGVDRHVTIPLAPDRKGRIRPHLTTREPGRERSDHEYLLNVAFEDWLEIWKQFQDGMVYAFQAALVPTTLEELADLGYIVSSPPAEVVFAQLSEYWALRGKELKLRLGWDLLVDLMTVLLHHVVHPSTLKPDDARNPLCVFLIDDDGEILDVKLLMYFARPVGLGEKPGWYTMVPTTISLELAIQGLVQTLGTDFFRMMEATVRHFGHEPDADRWSDLKGRYGY